jgi:hypothetical protein
MRQRKINLISVLAAIASNTCLYSLIYMGFRIDWFVCLLTVGLTFMAKIITFVCFYNCKDDYFNVSLFVIVLAIMGVSTYITTKVKAYIDNDNSTQS